ncbi:GMC family oxidoreductase N-terminal domain-containing protein [Natrinema salifodinae]|uniref:Choline dehydrogenase n=1 Tax=Natrinema salifodinae TaxID=1202768 RepID=A0A1I0PH82_9EURY|nr:GMC family oxidoreductase N-terminal domain-containing protein [Natrinema salifodinae]SEW13768.1 Choline dehydrogenase [Natrinema salifodinae]
MTTNSDVIVIGAGGDGPALAWQLGAYGLDVQLIEAGPWHGNEKWPRPHEDPGATESSDPDDLSGDLLDRQFNGLEEDMNNSTAGKLRFGPADRTQGSWDHETGGELTVNQVSGVGGTTLHYYANHPRTTVPSVNDSDAWPIDYGDLVPYYRLIEAKFDFGPGATATKEAVLYAGAERLGLELNDGLNVTGDDLPSYRPTPSLISQPDEALEDEDYDGPFTYPEVEGDTLANDSYRGASTPKGAPVREKARKSSNVSWVPEALDTGNVTIRPNTFVTNVRTENGAATGVDFRDTWSGQTGSMDAHVVVMAAGSLQTPRLWLNSGLPDNGWVGKGLTHHWFDAVHGVFDPDALEDLIGERTVDPHVGQPWGGRVELDEGIIGVVGNTPALHGTLLGTSAAGLAADNDTEGEPWDTHGQLVGAELKDKMADYRRTVTLLLSIDDEPLQRNGVRLADDEDENGKLAKVEWQPSEADYAKRETLARTGAELLRAAGADSVHRTNMPPYLIHIHSTMSMGKVIDEGGEAYDVDRLFVGDHSAIPNALGGQNPTHTGQALALRTADAIYDRYFTR